MVVDKTKFRPPQDIKVVLGAINLNARNIIEVYVEKVFVHPGYHPKENKWNDIALIRTKGNLCGHDKVHGMMATLPTSNKTSQIIGRKVWTVGYGMVDPKKKKK